MSEPTIPQFRAGRALLGWTQERLTERARVAPLACHKIESGQEVPIRDRLCLALTLEEAGVRFVPGGVVLEARA